MERKQVVPWIHASFNRFGTRLAKHSQKRGRTVKTRITYLGGPTYLLEIGSFRLLTDPGFDPKGTERSEGPGHDLKKTMAPPVPAEKIGKIDAVLLSHQQHYDNLDNVGRTLLPQAGRVLTTPESAGILGGSPSGLGLSAWNQTLGGDRMGKSLGYAVPICTVLMATTSCTPRIARAVSLLYIGLISVKPSRVGSLDQPDRALR